MKAKCGSNTPAINIAPTNALLRMVAPDRPLAQAVRELGGVPVSLGHDEWPVALIGDVEPIATAVPSWRLTWEGRAACDRLRLHRTDLSHRRSPVHLDASHKLVAFKKIYAESNHVPMCNMAAGGAEALHGIERTGQRLYTVESTTRHALQRQRQNRVPRLRAASWDSAPRGPNVKRMMPHDPDRCCDKQRDRHRLLVALYVAKQRFDRLSKRIAEDAQR